MSYDLKELRCQLPQRVRTFDDDGEWKGWDVQPCGAQLYLQCEHATELYDSDISEDTHEGTDVVEPDLRRWQVECENRHVLLSSVGIVEDDGSYPAPPTVADIRFAASLGDWSTTDEAQKQVIKRVLGGWLYDTMPNGRAYWFRSGVVEDMTDECRAVLQEGARHDPVQ